MDESEWIHRAQSAEARLATVQSATQALKDKVQLVKETLCAKERGDGMFQIDFDALAQKLSVEHALEFRAAIDKHHRISGGAGEKPRVKLKLPSVADVIKAAT